MAMAGAVVTSGTAPAQTPDASDWGYYGGDMFGQRFSRLSEINRKNVTHLTVAWTYRTGENGAGFARANKLSFEATPILAFGLLYLETPTNIVIALDPETGVQRWRFDPHIDRSRQYSEASSRGVSIWEDSDSRHTGACARRVLTGTLVLGKPGGGSCPIEAYLFVKRLHRVSLSSSAGIGARVEGPGEAEFGVDEYFTAIVQHVVDYL